jgi:coenzyme Q-binding protein COQ10
LPKFSFEKFVNSQKQKIFDIVKDYENYQKLLPQYFPSIRILSTRNDVSVVEEHMMLGERELVMMTKHVIQEPNLHEIFVIGGDAKGTHIVEKFEQEPNGTKLLVHVDFKLKGSMHLSNLLGKSNIEQNYSKIMDEFVKIAEI